MVLGVEINIGPRLLRVEAVSESSISPILFYQWFRSCRKTSPRKLFTALHCQRPELDLNLKSAWVQLKIPDTIRALRRLSLLGQSRFTIMAQLETTIWATQRNVMRNFVL